MLRTGLCTDRTKVFPVAPITRRCKERKGKYGVVQETIRFPSYGLDPRSRVAEENGTTPVGRHSIRSLRIRWILPDDDREKLLALTRGLRGLYEDPDFRARSESISYSRKMKNIVWKRPKELTPSPRLFVAGVSRTDIVQGNLGDCWFLSSCAALAREEALVYRVRTDPDPRSPEFLPLGPTPTRPRPRPRPQPRPRPDPDPDPTPTHGARSSSSVIPPDQDLTGPNYKGALYVRFWQFGQWVTVYIDDRLPTLHGKLIFARCTDKNEFWIPLVEKAYAKIHGCYEAIEGGQAMDALVDLTGGLAECYQLSESSLDQRANLFKRLYKSAISGAFITCSRKGDWTQATKADAMGLVGGHAYTVTGIAKINASRLGHVNLVRVRNPWANSAEWKGPWCDGDENWRYVDESTKRKLDLQHQADGEFWITYEDFCLEFEEVSMCTMGPDFDSDGIVDRIGQVKAIHGAWRKGDNAGGSRNDLVRFATNPQYLLTITEPDDYDPNGECSVLVSLMQEYRRQQRSLGVKMLQIGFMVYENPSGGRLGVGHFRRHSPIASATPYVNHREVNARMELEPGRYTVVPSTYRPGCDSGYILRVYGGTSNFQIKSTEEPGRRISEDYFQYHYETGSYGAFINYREIYRRLELKPGHYVIVPATFMPDCEAGFMIRVYAAKPFQLTLLPHHPRL
ncbi:unnamed protein product [Darwinula stevensoni]|uniref:Calpain catalytic domain-containing protein n=1 Tax=Darwinula stevensoni TaxID=69355 RepID=A0A7R9A0D2_9CRUS|nr:unnamed protein product [Darwinula stevensoni]CAG0885337.1 unnamed protein product [Darwinula stevensoni]